MNDQLTDAVRARVDACGAQPSVADVYSAVGAELYDDLVGRDRSEVREMLALARRAPGPVLDLAAGNGRLTIPLVKTGSTVTALDLSPDMLAYLTRALPSHAQLDVVVGDMRDFHLGRGYGLILVGATSVTLLDRCGRGQMYRAVARHLRDGGTFALTIADAEANGMLRESWEQIVQVPRAGTSDDYLYSQQPVDGGGSRLVNWVRLADLDVGGVVPVLSSRPHVLDVAEICDELIDAGFRTPIVRRVRSAGENGAPGILLLETGLRTAVANGVRGE